MKIKIDKNISAPEKRNVTRADVRDAISRMEVGDSFSVPLFGKDLVYLRTCVGSLSSELGLRFSTRASDDGCRVWRIS